MLLRAGADVAIDARVGHPAAAGPAAILMQDHAAVYMHAAEGDSLGDGPLHGSAGGSYGEAFSGAPEGGGGVVVRGTCVGMDVAVDLNVVRAAAEADDFGVKAYREIHVVAAGLEEDGVAFGAELVGALDGVDFVHLRLHGGGGSGRIKDDNVRAEVRMAEAARMKRGGDEE